MQNQQAVHQNLAASIGKNTLFGFLSNFAQMGTRLVTVPIVIHYIGLDGYGIWNVIMAASTYMRFGSVGVKTAFQKYVAEATGNDDYARANRLLSTGCALMLLISLLALIPVSFFSQNIAKMAGVPTQFLRSTAGSISLLAWIMLMANVGAVYESIVLGGHRIDVARKLGTVLTVAEAVCILVVLRMGFGLLAMAAIMGVSELVYILGCYIASKRVLPQISVSISYVDPSTLRELFRFAGSYQLLNLLAVIYSSIVPLAILNVFGATTAGVFGVVSRVATSAGTLQDAFLSPILSGGAMVFASGSVERMRALITKAFKVTLGLAVLPLSFIAAFGSLIAYAWTGQTNSVFGATFWLLCLTMMFRAFSMLSFVLYRTSGRALLDNALQVLRSVLLLCVVAFTRKIGFYGLLAGTALIELLGMSFMLFALMRTFELFHVRSIVPDLFRVVGSAVVIFGTGALALYIPNPANLTGRMLAAVQLAEVSLACAIVAWPVLLYTGSITRSEGRALFGALIPRKAA
jgi:O-antigen/teichoic acid export membrane protein